MFCPRSNTNPPGDGSVTLRGVSSWVRRTGGHVMPTSRADSGAGSMTTGCQSVGTRRASCTSPINRSAYFNGPTAASQDSSLTTTGAPSTSNCTSALVSPPYCARSSQASLLAHQPSASTSSTTFSPGCSKAATS